jgi:hypothetical protein
VADARAALRPKGAGRPIQSGRRRRTTCAPCRRSLCTRCANGLRSA